MEWPTNPPCSREDLRYCMGPGCAQLEPQRSLSRPLCPRSIRRATPSAQQRTLQPPRSCQLIVSSFFLFFFCFITLGFYQLSRAPHVAGRKLTATFRSPFAFCYHPVSVHLRVVQIPGYMHAGGGWWWRIRRSSNSKEKG